MEIRFNCQTCARKIQAESDMGGEYAQCPGCGASLMVPAASLQRGTVLGDFQIDRSLGSGAMGEVYLANQISMEQEISFISSDNKISDEEPTQKELKLRQLLRA